ncbi:MAG: RHS repeat-associated core domain-containing protein, partial [Armatimonadetes bacterium]|nr:RHS repeat-associated core domain-containing protein [Armatimonadota bacterium]
VNNTPTARRGDYYRTELAVMNGSAPVWLGVTNVAVLNQGANPDIVASVTGNVFVARSPEICGYDADGNMTNDGRWVFTWDAENRLKQVESKSDAPSLSRRKVTWEFDGQGRRIRQTAYDGSSGSYVVKEDLKFLSDGWAHIAELNATNNALVRSYVWGLDLSGSQAGAGGVGGLLIVHSVANGAHFCAFDGNGNVVALVKATDGTETARYEYGPFGEVIRATGTMAKENPFRFSTKRTDNNPDFVLYEYRLYSPSMGRWLSRDPIEEEGASNLYSHVGGNPISQVDFLGLAFYAIGGTCEKSSSKANAWQLYNETQEKPARYFPGPTDGPTGSDSYAIALKVLHEIQIDFCVEKAKTKCDLTINLTGWSRGAMIASRVAKMLQYTGVRCPAKGLSWDEYRPVKVNWVGLFDAVAMTPDFPNVFPTAVPPNVAHFDHAIKTKHTGKQRMFPTWHFSGSTERAFNNKDGSLTTHADIGMSVILGNHNDAYPWIRGQAIAAGVSF